VAWVERSYQVSQRKACRALGVARSSVRYVGIRPPQTALRRRMRELAVDRISYGYRRVYILLRREGWQVNHKRVYRVYREEGLGLRRRRPRRRRSAVQRGQRAVVTRPNECWSMDFMHDALADGRTLRVLTVVDIYTRECLAVEAATGFRGDDVARVLTRLGWQRGLPTLIRCDNGTEFTSKALDHWAYRQQVKLDFSRPGKPTDNAFIESFNASLRRECLSQHYFIDAAQARSALRAWQEDYNTVRPHSTLGNQTPAQFRAGQEDQPDRSEAAITRV
jgi:putative transposase